MVAIGERVGAGFLTLVFGAIGDIISRAVWFNCSLDKAWTLTFAVPPLSAVPAIMYWGDFIEPGVQSCGSSFDWFIVAIPVFVIMISILWNKWLKPKYGESGQKVLDVVLILIFTLVYTGIRYYKYTIECDALYPSKQDRPHGNYLLKAFYRSLVTNVGIAIFNLILSNDVVQMIPLIGKGFKLWELLGDFVPGLTHAIPLTLIHWIMNLNGNDPSYMNTTCN